MSREVSECSSLNQQLIDIGIDPGKPLADIKRSARSQVRAIITPAIQELIVDVQFCLIVGWTVGNGHVMPCAIEQSPIDVVNVAVQSLYILHFGAIGIRPAGVIAEAGLVAITQAVGKPDGIAIAIGLGTGFHPEADG